MPGQAIVQLLRFAALCEKSHIRAEVERPLFPSNMRRGLVRRGGRVPGSAQGEGSSMSQTGRSAGSDRGLRNTREASVSTPDWRGGNLDEVRYRRETGGEPG